ncbi:hypothetical protein [Bartonella doshiae]|uniref:UDP-3-O-[3-hydroxymyristoyl] glucosamine N-acyltransferase n=2 Tax=Bartonella doshiae TaxID=33044 RepID=A0A380ZH21_BARDO|nr:hypothetical protein [Bartonella doshiae]EJF79119.1 hypothetical protein MCS_01490 [Bartonella doshiae NCTC 12862 = ATCC 700133]MBB6160109.1 carbonic anhydrase/acetyltransferase-like protein (isoleucine patch superfamily) [Bartonella doshiae]SUV45475.1 Uncharacterised protein [Bartonella doshiae]
MKKYEFTNETKQVYDADTRQPKHFYRIRALRDFDDVKAGDLGGFIEKEDNLSHDGNCWVYDNAIVSYGAIVSENAKIRNEAIVADDAKVYGNVIVSDKAKIYGRDTHVYGNAKVFDNACVSGTMWFREKGWVYGKCVVNGNAKVYGDAALKEKKTFRDDVCSNDAISEKAA